jgi:ABC-type phosphate/phosphonate transport system substrate-binding protein
MVAAELRNRGVADVPAGLDRRANYEAQWQERGLLLGQACGYDVYCANDHQLQIVGIPRYRMDGCEGARYRSFVIVREDSSFESLEQLRGARCVINSPRSHSGMNVLQALIAPLSTDGRFFSEVHVSGAHERSLEKIAAHTADVAAIDCITYGLLQRHRPHALVATRIIHRTGSLAAPPYITGAASPPALLPVLRDAIAGAIGHLDSTDREDLGLLGVESGSLEDYQELDALRELAEQASYHELAKP